MWRRVIEPNVLYGLIDAWELKKELVGYLPSVAFFFHSPSPSFSLDPFADQQLNQSSLDYALNCVSKRRDERLADDQKPADRDEIRQAKSVRMKSNQEPEVLFTVALVVDLIHQEFISLSSREREKQRRRGKDRQTVFIYRRSSSIGQTCIYLSLFPSCKLFSFRHWIMNVRERSTGWNSAFVLLSWVTFSGSCSAIDLPGTRVSVCVQRVENNV